jgi:hypothetical protein
MVAIRQHLRWLGRGAELALALELLEPIPEGGPPRCGGLELLAGPSELGLAVLQASAGGGALLLQAAHHAREVLVFPE